MYLTSKLWVFVAPSNFKILINFHFPFNSGPFACPKIIKIQHVTILAVLGDFEGIMIFLYQFFSSFCEEMGNYLSLVFVLFQYIWDNCEGSFG